MPTGQDRAFQLLIEEYKSLREEIGRFQTQQKTLIGAELSGLGTLGVALLGQKEIGNPILAHLMLVGPIFFGWISLLFFEAENGVIRAGYYTGVDLRRRAKAMCGTGRGILAWEKFRATHEGKLSECSPPARVFFILSKLLFIMPSVFCLLAFFPLRFSDDHRCTFMHVAGETVLWV